MVQKSAYMQTPRHMPMDVSYLLLDHLIYKANIFLGLIEYELNSLLIFDSTLKDIC